jgi:hypothetical protein
VAWEEAVRHLGTSEIYAAFEKENLSGKYYLTDLGQDGKISVHKKLCVWTYVCVTRGCVSVAVEKSVTSSCEYEEPVRSSKSSVCIANSTFYSNHYTACIISKRIA